MEEKTLINRMSYRLCLGTYIDNPNKPEDKIELDQRSEKTISLNQASYKVSLLGVKYNRKIYQPGEIETEINIVAADDQVKKVPTAQEVSDFLLRRWVELYVVSNSETDKNTSTPPILIANKYYVYEINPQLSQQSHGSIRMSVKLTIYSIDKLMTLDKYSKAYVVKKLGSGILDPESKSFGFAEKQIQVDKDHLRQLKYSQSMTISKLGSNVTIQIPSEFIHPYLVQYNESFYSFMARTANRCGEFFYFEDGKLTLGLPETKEPYEFSQYQNVTYQNLSSSPLQVGEYARDSMKDDDGEAGDTNYTPVRKNAAGFPKDAFPFAASYNAEVANDEYFFPLYADKFTSFAREMGYADKGGDIATQQVFTVLEAAASTTDGAVGFGKDLGIGTALSEKDGFFNASDTNESGNATYINNYVRTEQGDGHATVLFGSVKPDGWTTLRYYEDVRRYEEEQQKQMICIDMGTSFLPLKLGEEVKVSGLEQTFVIVQIRLMSNDKWSRNYDKYEMEESSDQFTGQQSMKIFAIPLAKVVDSKGTEDLKPFPPVLSGSPFRKADPQTAFITDNNDPKYQGRVRIVYPWQSMNMPERKELAEAERTLMEAQKKYDELQAAYDEKQAKLDAWKQANRKDSRKKKAKDDIDEQIKQTDKAISTLDKDITNYTNLNAALQKEAAFMRGLTGKDSTIMANSLQAEITALKGKYKTGDMELNIVTRMEQALGMLKKETQQADKDATLKDYANLFESEIPDNQAVILQKTNEKDAEEASKEQLKIDKENLDKTEEAFKNTLDKVDQKEVTDAKKELDDAKKSVTTAQKNVDAKVKDFSRVVGTMATPWIRVASPMATEGGGTFFKPMVGDEVLVNFESGNIERPYVVGSLYSKNILAPDERINRTVGPNLHANASIAIVSPNGHGITFKDPTKGDGFFTSVYPGLGVFNEYAGKVGLNIPLPKTKDVTGGIRIGDRYGLYSIDMSSDKRSVKISSSMGTVRLNAFTGITISAPNGDVKIEGKNVSIKAGNNLSFTSGMNISKDVDSSTTKGWFQSKIDTAFATAGSKPVEMFVAPFLDASLFRTVLEVFLKPIDGTMLIKSKRYMKLEAGSGKAVINKNRYKDWEPGKGKKMEKSQAFFKMMMEIISEMDDRFNDFKLRYRVLWADAWQKKEAYVKKQKEYFDDDMSKDILQKAFDASVKDKWEKHQFTEDDFDKLKLAQISLTDNNQRYLSRYARAVQVVPAANALGEAAHALHKQVDAFLKLFADWEKADAGEFRNYMAELFKSIRSSMIGGFEIKYGVKLDGLLESPVPDDAYSTGLRAFKRRLAAKFLAKVAGIKDPLNPTEPLYPDIKVGYQVAQITNKQVEDNYMWNKFVNDLEKWTMHPFLKSLVDSLKGGLEDALNADGWKATINEGDIWSDRKGGQILFSDDENSTVDFDGGALNVEQQAQSYNLGKFKQLLIGLD